MTTTTLLALIAAVFVLGATPGPAVFAGVARTLTSGLASAMLLTLGMLAGDILLLMLAVFGMAAIAGGMGAFFALVKIAGGGYLIWLGIKAWRTPPAPPGAAPAGQGAWRTSMGGLALTLGNPKAVLFYAAFLPGFIDVTRLGAADLLLLVAVVAIVLFLVMLGYCTLAARARALFQSGPAMRRLNRLAGTLMIGAGMAVALR